MTEQRLFQATVVVERRDGLSHDVNVEPSLWAAGTRAEARGLAIPAAMAKYPGYGLRAEAVTDITDTMRAWVRLNPAENSAKGSEPSCDEGNPATDEPPLYISREEGNSSSQSLPSAENSNAEPSAL